jgi:ABC-2 type transport system ATP-binding protein
MPVVSMASIDKRFGALKAVDDLSFEIGRGEVFALLGPNGAGKTTTVRLLLGMIAPDRGVIRWSLDAGRPEPRAADIGYLPEDRGLYRDQPVLRTLVYLAALRGMPHGEAEAEARRWLARFDLAGRGHEKLEALSKGNQQKVQFVSAVLHGPRVALLDEPFAGLDPVNQDFVVDLIRELRDAGTTIVLSAHQMDLVERLADRVLLISHGRAVLRGTLAEIRSAAESATRLVFDIEGDSAGGADGWPDIVEATIGPGRVTVLVRRGADLGPVVAHAASRFRLRGVRSESVSLHDLYVQAVRRAGTAGPAEVAS